MYDLAAQCTPHGKSYIVNRQIVHKLTFFCHLNRLFQCAELVVHLLQFVLVVALGHDAAACLEPEDTVAADKVRIVIAWFSEPFSPMKPMQPP